MAIAQTLYNLIYNFFDLSYISVTDTSFVRLISLFLAFLVVLVPFFVVYKIITLFLR